MAGSGTLEMPEVRPLRRKPSRGQANERNIAQSVPEDARFKEGVEEFHIRPELAECARHALEELIPRYKIVADMRFEYNKNARRESGSGSVVEDVGEWNYRDEVKTWDLLQRLCHAQATNRHEFEQQIGVVCGQVEEGLSENDREQYWGACNGEQVLFFGNHPLVQESDLLIARRAVETTELDVAMQQPGQTLCWLKAVLDWLQANVDTERLEKMFLWKEEMWRITREENEGATSWGSGPKKPTGFVPMDPDAVYREDGLCLEYEDQRNEQHFMYALWMLLRCGHVGWARQLQFSGKKHAKQEHEEEWSKYKARQSLEQRRENIDEAQVLLECEKMEQPLVGKIKEIWNGQFGEHRDAPIVEVLCKIWGQPWRAASLTGGDFHHDPLLCGWKSRDPEDPSGVHLEEQGCTQRLLWKEMCVALAESLDGDHMTTDDGDGHTAEKYEQALYGVLGGEEKLAHDVLDDWEDRLWVKVKIAFDANVDAAVQEQARPPPHYAAAPTRRIEAKRVSETLEDIMSKLQPDGNDKIHDNAMRRPLHFVQQLLVLGDLSNLLKALRLQISNAKEQTWRDRLLRFSVHLVLLVRETPAPKTMNPPLMQIEEEVILGCKKSETGVLRLPTWNAQISTAQVENAKSEENANNCDALLMDYVDYLAHSAQEEAAPTYIARLVEPDAQVDALVRLYNAMESSSHLAQELSELPDLSLHYKHIVLQHQAFQDYREGISAAEENRQPLPPDVYALRIILEATCRVAKQRPIAPRQIKWVCMLAMEASTAIPMQATSFLRQPVRVALELLQELMGHIPGDGMWRPHVQDAIQLVACLPQAIRAWTPDPSNHADCADARELAFWCEWLYGWDLMLRAEQSLAQAGTIMKVQSDVLQHTLVEGMPADAVEVRALGAVRHLVEALRMLPPQERMQMGHQALLHHLVPETIRKIHHLLFNVLCEKFLEQGNVPLALQVLEEALQMAPLIADREQRQAPLGDFISTTQMQEIVCNLAATEVKRLKICDERQTGWAEYASKMQSEREKTHADWYIY